jgi:Protein of unknown function (DUF664)
MSRAAVSASEASTGLQAGRSPARIERRSGACGAAERPGDLVEETARHDGHLDILRELADGVTGT